MLPDAVREKIESRFGSPILYSKECEALSKSIENTCDVRISTTTLKRLLGFAKGIEQPRMYTFDVLASYIGFKDWNSLLADIEKAKRVAVPPLQNYNRNEVSSNNVHLLHHQISISLTTQVIDNKRVTDLCRQFGKNPEIISFVIEMISIAARQKNIEFLKQVFDLPYLFDSEIHSPLEFYYVGQTMGLMLRQYTDIAEELTEFLAANKNAQQYFIESFVDEDYLQGYYGKLLDTYHTCKQEKVQDKLFYLALKYSQSLQSGDEVQRKIWYEKIKGLQMVESMHQIPVARYIGICLSEEIDHHFQSSSTYYSIIRKYIYTKDYETAIGFSFYLCRELFRSNRNDWLIKVITDFEQQHKKTISDATNHWVIKMENQLLIYSAYVYHIMGNCKKAKLCFSNIDMNLFDPFIYQQIHKDFILVSEKLKGE